MGSHPNPSDLEDTGDITGTVDTAVIAGNVNIAEDRLGATEAGTERTATGIRRSSDVTTTAQTISSSTAGAAWTISRAWAIDSRQCT